MNSDSSKMTFPMSDATRAGRSMTMSQHGIVATSHSLASQAGLDMLRSGGSAMDAAIAAGLTLGVVEPAMTGIGGDVWLLYYEASTGKVHALNGSGRSPRNLSRAYFHEKSVQEIDTNSWEAVTVPGAVDAYFTAHERFGKKPVGDLFEPAIRYAEEGFPVAEVVHAVWNSQVEALSKDLWAAKCYLDNGRAPARSGVFKNPHLAASLRRIAEGGRDAFYEGAIAEEIVRYAKETNGFFCLDDFARHRSEWVDALSTNYRGYDVYQCPPNGQGMGVLMMLNMLEGFDLKSMGRQSPEYLHHLIEAKKLAYADLYKFVADPATTTAMPIDGLLSKEYAASRGALIQSAKAQPEVPPGIPTSGDTIYLTAIDSEGNAASFINSLFGPFGSGIVGGETGILMQNRGNGFTLEEGHFNEYAPGKRPYHTIIPGMVLKDDALYMSYGLMGGDMQPQGHVQFLLNHIDFGLNIQQSMEIPRWRHTDGDVVLLETGTPETIKDALAARGHRVKTAGYLQFGGAQAVMIDPKSGTYLGASDPRKDGSALGY